MRHTRVPQAVLVTALFVATAFATTALFAQSALADTTPTVAASVTVTSTTVSSTTATLNWVVSPGNDSVIQYQIYSTSSDPNSPATILYNPSLTTVTFTGLLPSTAYTFKIDTISAEPVFGNETTTDVTITTDAAGVTPPPTTTTTRPTTTTTRPVTTTTRPPTTTTTIRSNPTAPVIKSLTPTVSTITVRWLAPTSPQSPVTKYVVAVLYKNKTIRTGGARASARALIIRNVKPRTTYTVVLAARLKSGSIQISGRVTTK